VAHGNRELVSQPEVRCNCTGLLERAPFQVRDAIDVLTGRPRQLVAADAMLDLADLPTAAGEHDEAVAMCQSASDIY
jgi:hypothetical protein